MSLSIMSFEARCKLWQQTVEQEHREGLTLLHDSMLAALQDATVKAARYDSLGGKAVAVVPPARRHADPDKTPAFMG